MTVTRGTGAFLMRVASFKGQFRLERGLKKVLWTCECLFFLQCWHRYIPIDLSWHRTQLNFATCTQHQRFSRVSRLPESDWAVFATWIGQLPGPLPLQHDYCSVKQTVSRKPFQQMCLWNICIYNYVMCRHTFCLFNFFSDYCLFHLAIWNVRYSKPFFRIFNIRIIY